MTMHDVINQVYSLAIGGYFNREKFTKQRFTNLIKAWMQGDQKKIVIEIALPDGWWHMTVNQYAPGEYDYYVPQTREQESRIIRDLLRE